MYIYMLRYLYNPSTIPPVFLRGDRGASSPLALAAFRETDAVAGPFGVPTLRDGYAPSLISAPWNTSP